MPWTPTGPKTCGRLKSAPAGCRTLSPLSGFKWRVVKVWTEGCDCGLESRAEGDAMTHSIPWIYLGGLVGGAFPSWSWQLESDGPPREIVGSARRRGAQQSGGPRLSHLAPPLCRAPPLDEALPPGLQRQPAEGGGAYPGGGSPSRRCLGSARGW